MVSQRLRRLDQKGWSLAELLVVIAVIMLLAAIAIPFFLTYLQSSTVRAGALEMRTALNQGKQLAITRRQNICVQPVGNGYQFQPNACGSPPLILAGADGAGTFRLQNNVVVTVNTVAPVFTPLGNAAPAGQLSVTGPGGGTLTVTVSAAGRITTP